MNTSPSRRNGSAASLRSACSRSLARLVLAAVWLALPAALFAQGSGAVSGRVFNPATQQYVRNAVVRVIGTPIETTTGGDGHYRLANVPAGEVTVSVAFTGYATASATVNVTAGQTATHNFELRRVGATGDEPIELSTFTVSTEREGNAKAIMDQRAAMNIKNVVASDVFGQVAEGNIGEFVKYLPGVSLDYVEADTRAIRVRGLPPKYASVTLDGNRIASSASSNLGAARQFEFEQNSITSVEAIELSKTVSADMDADSPAGAINLRSKSAFDRKGRYFKWQLNAIANSDNLTLNETIGPDDHHHRKIRPGGQIDYSDVFLDGRLGVVFTASESNMFNEQKRLQLTYDYPSNTALPTVLTTILYKDGPKFTERSSAAVGFDYKLNDFSLLSLRIQYNYYHSEFHNREWRVTSNRANLDPASTLTSITARPSGTATTAQTSNSSQGKYGDTVNIAPRWEYKRDNLQLDASASYSRSRNHYNDLGSGFVANTVARLGNMGWTASRSSENDAAFTITQTSGADWRFLSNYTQNPTNNVQSNPRWSKAQQFQGDFNARVDLDWKNPTWLKAGVRLREMVHDIQRHTLRWSFVGPDGIQNTADDNLGAYVSPINFDPGWGGNLFTGDQRIQYVNRAAFAELLADQPGWFVANDYGNYEATFLNNHDFKEFVGAAYVMMTTRLNKLTLQAGVRDELTKSVAYLLPEPLPDSEVEAAGFTPDTVPFLLYQYRGGERVARYDDYNDVFVSASAKYNFTENLILHGSFNQAIQRPDVANLAGSTTINESASTISIPNPDLQPETSNNYSVRMEYYFEPAGYFAAGVFLNDIKDVQYETNLTADEAGFGGDPTYAGYTFETFVNGDSLRNKGFELEYSQQLSFLPKPFNGLNVFATYSRTEVSDELKAGGAVPQIATGGISYKYGPFGASIKTTWYDRSFDSTGSGGREIRWLRDRQLVDLNLNYKLPWAGLELFLSGRNIFDAEKEWYSNNDDRLWRIERYGVTWTFGVSGEF